MPRTSNKSSKKRASAERRISMAEDKDRWAGFFAALDEFRQLDPDFTLERNQRQARPGLDHLFERDPE